MNSDSLTRAFLILIRRDLMLAIRHRAEMANPLLFFILVTSRGPRRHLGGGPARCVAVD
jgi:heme exporter protein B